MEHVVSSHIMLRYFEARNILTPHQHRICKGFSTKTQLISVLDDWFTSLDRRIHTDVLLLDFSKAFHTVPHNRLLHKLNYYGINGKTHRWIKNFLLIRSQCIQVSGERLEWVKVSSGVPQGTVLGPLLFLVYINDITCRINSKIKLLADNAVMYSEITTQNDIIFFFSNWHQSDINLVQYLANGPDIWLWQPPFTSHSITSSTSPFPIQSNLQILAHAPTTLTSSAISPQTPMPTSTPSSLAQYLYGTVCQI